jgi:hypothetical protein
MYSMYDTIRGLYSGFTSLQIIGNFNLYFQTMNPSALSSSQKKCPTLLPLISISHEPITCFGQKNN